MGENHKGWQEDLAAEMDRLEERHVLLHGVHRVKCPNCPKSWCAKCLRESPPIGLHTCPKKKADLPVWDEDDDGLSDEGGFTTPT